LRSRSDPWLGPLLLGTFGVRLGLAVCVWKISGPLGFYEMGDSHDYLTLAGSMLHGSFSPQGVPNIGRTPGYPLLLVPALAFKHFAAVAILENVLLAVACAWLIWRIVEYLAPESSASRWAVLLYAVEPISFLYSVKIMTETLFCAQLLLFVWLVISDFDERSFLRLISAALVLASAAYTRPAAVYLGAWLMPVFLFFPRSLTFARRAATTIVFLLVFCLALAPWVVRNSKVAEYRGFASISDKGLYFYAAAAVQAKLEHKSFAQQQEEMGFWDQERYFQVHPEQRSWSEGKISGFMRVEAERILRQHLPTYLLLHCRGLLIVLLDTGATRLLRSIKLYPEFGGLLGRILDQGFYRGVVWLIREHTVVAVVFALLEIQLLLYYLLALSGAWRVRSEIVVFFGAIVLYFVLVSGGPLASGRLRAPIMPFICALAGVAIAKRRSWERIEKREPTLRLTGQAV